MWVAYVLVPVIKESLKRNSRMAIVGVISSFGYTNNEVSRNKYTYTPRKL